MKKQLFDDLVASLKEAGRIHRGEAEASRTFVFQPEDEPATEPSISGQSPLSSRASSEE